MGASRKIPSNQGDSVALPAPSRVAPYFDAVRLDLGGQLGEKLSDGAFGQGRRDHNSMRSFAFGVDEAGEDVRFQSIKQLLD